MNYEYESEAHADAVSVVKLYVYKKDQAARACRCFSCKTDAKDRVDWFFGKGDWKSVKKSSKKTDSDIGDCGEEEYA